jgi:autotransporter-associated beta strand protein
LGTTAVTLNGGFLEFAGTGTYTRVTAMDGTSGGIIKSGTGSLTLQGNNTYTGETRITNGTLKLDRSGGTIADTNTVTVNGDTAILEIAQDETIANLNLALAATVNGPGTLTVDTAITPNIAISKTNNINASLAGDAYLKKTGQGTTILSAANSYTGGTIISGTNSKLAISGSGTLGSTSGSLTIETSTATLDLGGTSQTVGTVSAIGTVSNGTLNVSTQLSLGDPLTANAIGSATFDDLTLGSGSTYTFGLESGSANADQGTITGALTITSGSILDLVQLGTFTLGEKFTLFSYTSLGGLTGTFKDTGLTALADGATFSEAGGSWMIDYNDALAGLNGGTGDTFVTITAVVPEPSATMLAGGMGILALLRRRRA